MRKSIATHIHCTISNVGSQANRPSHRVMASCILNSRVNNNLSHRLFQTWSAHRIENLEVKPTFRRFAARSRHPATSSTIWDLQFSTKFLEYGCKPVQLVQRKVSNPPFRP